MAYGSWKCMFEAGLWWGKVILTFWHSMPSEQTSKQAVNTPFGIVLLAKLTDVGRGRRRSQSAYASEQQSDTCIYQADCLGKNMTYEQTYIRDLRHAKHRAAAHKDESALPSCDGQPRLLCYVAL